MFVCAHPAIDAGVRTPLMLQMVLGLDARRMSAAFLIAPDTLSRRLSRAKAKIATTRIGFALPEGPELPARLAHVLDAIYAAFTIGTDAASGDRAAALGREALWLGSVLAAGLPDQPEAQALLALMLYTAARRPAGRDAEGRFVPLDRQDPQLWTAPMIDDANRALARAARGPTPGRYQIEAAIAAAHAARRTGATVDRRAILSLYHGLFALYPTAGAAAGLAGALLQAGDARAALAALDTVPQPRAAAYLPWWAVRAEALRQAGDTAGALAALDRATALAADPALRDHLVRRRADWTM
jgi:RNA polymerase sigma-70 factor (ECF subfamily)